MASLDKTRQALDHLERLSRQRRRGKKLRLLFIDYERFCPTETTGYEGPEKTPYHLLKALDTDRDRPVAAWVKTIAPTLTASRVDEVVHAGEGEPLMLILLTDLALGTAGEIDRAAALAHRARAIMARAKQVGVLPWLAAACFAPPVPWPKGAGLTKEKIRPLFPDGELDGRRLPAFRPDRVGDAILLRTLAEMGEMDAEDLTAEGWARAPEAAAACLRRLWLHTGGRSRHHALIYLTGGTPQPDPDTPAAVLAAEDAAERGKALALLTRRPGGTNRDASKADLAWALALQDVAATRTASDEIRRTLDEIYRAALAHCPDLIKAGISPAQYLAGLDLVYAVKGDPAAVTAALGRLDNYLRTLPDRVERARLSAMGAVNAINCYGTAMASGKDWAQKPMAEAVERLEQTWQAFKADREIARRPHRTQRANSRSPASR